MTYDELKITLREQTSDRITLSCAEYLKIKDEFVKEFPDHRFIKPEDYGYDGDDVVYVVRATNDEFKVTITILSDQEDDIMSEFPDIVT